MSRKHGVDEKSRTPVTRRAFLQTTGLAAAGVGAGAVGVAGAAPGRRTASLDATGVPEMDVARVQAAVDEGGSILLRGDFDFGDLSVVIGRMGRNVEIFGVHGTRIHGGAPPFVNTSPDGGFAPQHAVGHFVDIDIHDLDFVEPHPSGIFGGLMQFLFAIYIERCGHTLIRDCRVRIAPPASGYIPWTAAFFLRLVDGTGTEPISITNNEITHVGTNSGSILYGHFVPTSREAVLIRDNTITLEDRGWDDGSVDPGRLIVAGVLCHGSGSNLEISGNTIGGADPDAIVPVQSCITLFDGFDSHSNRVFDNHFENTESRPLYDFLPFTGGLGFYEWFLGVRSAQIYVGAHVNRSTFFENHLGSGKVGFSLYFGVNGKAGVKMHHNAIEDNTFPPAQPNQIHYLIHDSIWALNPAYQYEVDIGAYPHFEDNTLAHGFLEGDVPGVLQTENVEFGALRLAGNVFDFAGSCGSDPECFLTPDSPVSDDPNPHSGFDRGPEILKIWCLMRNGDCG